jgi:hypothetical protein
VSNTSARKTARCGSCPRRCLFEVAPAASSCLPVQQNSMTHRVTCCNLALIRLLDLDFLVLDRLWSRPGRIRSPYGACPTPETKCCIRCTPRLSTQVSGVPDPVGADLLGPHPGQQATQAGHRWSYRRAGDRLPACIAQQLPVGRGRGAPGCAGAGGSSGRGRPAASGPSRPSPTAGPGIACGQAWNVTVSSSAT